MTNVVVNVVSIFVSQRRRVAIAIEWLREIRAKLQAAGGAGAGEEQEQQLGLGAWRVC